MEAVQIKYHIQLDDLDFMEIVSHYKWIQLCERFRTKIFKERYKKLLKDGLGVVIADLTVKYKRPAVYDQEVVFEISVLESKVSSAIVRHRALDKDQKELMIADIRLVCIDETKRAVPMPDYFISES